MGRGSALGSRLFPKWWGTAGWTKNWGKAKKRLLRVRKAEVLSQLEREQEANSYAQPVIEVGEELLNSPKLELLHSPSGKFSYDFHENQLKIPSQANTQGWFGSHPIFQKICGADSCVYIAEDFVMEMNLQTGSYIPDPLGPTISQQTAAIIMHELTHAFEEHAVDKVDEDDVAYAVSEDEAYMRMLADLRDSDLSKDAIEMLCILKLIRRGYQPKDHHKEYRAKFIEYSSEGRFGPGRLNEIMPLTSVWMREQFLERDCKSKREVFKLPTV